MTRLNPEDFEVAWLRLVCSYCGARPGDWCTATELNTNAVYYTFDVHKSRKDDADEIAALLGYPEVVESLRSAWKREHQKLAAVKALVTHARKISPSPTMSVYVLELERALGLTDQAAPHKVGIDG